MGLRASERLRLTVGRLSGGEGELRQAWRRADGGWNGVIDASPRSAEVGFVLFRSLKPQTAGQYQGTLAMPENGSTHEVVIVIEGDKAKAVAGKWIFSKTLLLETAP